MENTRSDRQWMNFRLKDGFLIDEFEAGIVEFIDFAQRHPDFMDGTKIKCPCSDRKCQNRSFEEPDAMRFHLAKNGFVKDYYVWYKHGEKIMQQTSNQNVQRSVEVDAATEYAQPADACEAMLMDVIGPSFNPDVTEDEPTPAAKELYEMLRASEEEVWPGNPHGHTKLSAVARLLNLKAKHHFSERCFDDICEFIKELLSENNAMTNSFYSTKKLMQGLGLPVQKIHCCNNGCMIYWGEDSELSTCTLCNHPRYKRHGYNKQKSNVPYKKMYCFPLTPRLQRLYASNATANDMRWHKEHITKEGIMRHCSDSLAWKHFDHIHPEFAGDSRNVRLGLCTDGFQSFGQTGQQYSSWPVIVTPYNLPPWMCMKDEYMFLSVIVPGPRNPKEKLDVFLQPLIVELKELWEVGVQTYDVSSKQNFQMQVALMWTISDFPAYSMLSGWSTAGKLACPHCMENSDAITLSKGGKTSWFDNHRKFLPTDHPF